MNSADLKKILITLYVNGYDFKYVDRLSKGATLICASKYDNLGAIIKYTFLIIMNGNDESCLDSLKIQSDSDCSTPVVISDSLITDKFIEYGIKEFEKKIGGFVEFDLILRDDLPDILDELGHNKLPINFNGTPEDLLEDYIKNSLQYLLMSPARRFGKDRLFESLPDGVVIGKNQTNVLYDTKSYASGFKITSDDIKRFSSYIQDFNSKYSDYFGPVHSFLLVSGSNQDSDESMDNRSKELYKSCKTTLCYITAKELGMCVLLIKKNSDIRQSIDWKSFFSAHKLTKALIEKDIRKIRKDNLV